SSRSPDMMEAAVWRDPDRVDEWMGELEDRAGGRVLCLWVSCRVPGGAILAQGRIRRAVPGRRTLRLEGDQGAGEAFRTDNVVVSFADLAAWAACGDRQCSTAGYAGGTRADR